jgi:hypothetical protein
MILGKENLDKDSPSSVARASKILMADPSGFLNVLDDDPAGVPALAGHDDGA